MEEQQLLHLHLHLHLHTFFRCAPLVVPVNICRPSRASERGGRAERSVQMADLRCRCCLRARWAWMLRNSERAISA